jgi:hypothetical protein
MYPLDPLFLENLKYSDLILIGALAAILVPSIVIAVSSLIRSIIKRKGTPSSHDL